MFLNPNNLNCNYSDLLDLRKLHNPIYYIPTASVTAPPGLVTSASIPASGAATSKVPNILRGTSSPSKNTIDRQIVSHEATIELRKNHLGILSNHQKQNLTPTSNNGSTVTIQQSKICT